MHTPAPAYGSVLGSSVTPGHTCPRHVSRVHDCGSKVVSAMLPRAAESETLPRALPEPQGRAGERWRDRAEPHLRAESSAAVTRCHAVSRGVTRPPPRHRAQASAASARVTVYEIIIFALDRSFWPGGWEPAVSPPCYLFRASPAVMTLPDCRLVNTDCAIIKISS